MTRSDAWHTLPVGSHPSDRECTYIMISDDLKDPINAEDILAASAEARRRRGRPPGRKTYTPPEPPPPRISQSNQKAIFANALVALFSILAIVLGWFGYEYYKKIQPEQAEEGATCLLPISERIGSIATVAFYLSFPVWLLTTINGSFRKKVETPSPVTSAAAGVSPGPVQPSPVNGVSTVDGSPSEQAPGFNYDAKLDD